MHGRYNVCKRCLSRLDAGEIPLEAEANGCGLTASQHTCATAWTSGCASTYALSTALSFFIHVTSSVSFTTPFSNETTVVPLLACFETNAQRRLAAPIYHALAPHHLPPSFYIQRECKTPQTQMQ